MTHQTQDGQTMRLLGAEGNYAVGVMPGHRSNKSGHGQPSCFLPSTKDTKEDAGSVFVQRLQRWPNTVYAMPPVYYLLLYRCMYACHILLL